MANGIDEETIDDGAEMDHPLSGGCPPDWATAWGEDDFGVWVEFEIGEGKDAVPVRMRWIPPGTFWMGSPEDEEGRYRDEGPRHLVTLTEGFWLSETVVTQALWTGLGFENRSRFVSPDRPVENVNWFDAARFCNRLSEVFKLSKAVDFGGSDDSKQDSDKRVVGVKAAVDGFRLPTEAEWEYACRAGTTDATYAGPMKILGIHNAPVLDAIAWYGGNSSVDFDLAGGERKSGTHPVQKKLPNKWGLFDMLGNVYEWCQDWKGDYSDEHASDPHGPDGGSLRVSRGGAWHSHARHCRLAYRRSDPPTNRLGWIGFRLARGQGSPGAGGQDQSGGAAPEPG